MQIGWVLLHRKICENEMWLSEPFTKAQAWVDLFLNANHENKSLWIRGNEIKIKRGQLGWSELTMVSRWRWSKNKVRRFLKWLETEQQIKQQKSSFTTIITILNYNSYQKKDKKSTTDDTTDSTTDDTQTKNVNNDNNVKEYVGDAPNEVNQLLGYFQKEINPHIKFDNTTERKAATELLKAYGLNRVKEAMGFLQQRRKTDKYLPVITTPYQLYTKWAAIKQHLETKQTKIWKPKKMSQSLPSLPAESTK